MFTLPVLSIDGKQTDTVKLDETVFNDKILPSSLYQVICGYRANQRKGLAATKTRGEVSGGGKKPWRQKGTGRARVGSIRSPLWRHGGVVFGPHPRDFSYTVPKKMKDAALRFTLTQKVQEGAIIVVDTFAFDQPKAKILVAALTKLNAGPQQKQVVVVTKAIDSQVKRSAANLQFLRLVSAPSVNTYDVLKSRKVVITKEALEVLSKRLHKG